MTRMALDRLGIAQIEAEIERRRRAAELVLTALGWTVLPPAKPSDNGDAPPSPPAEGPARPAAGRKRPRGLACLAQRERGGADLRGIDARTICNALVGVSVLFADILDGYPVTATDCQDIEFADGRLRELAGELGRRLGVNPRPRTRPVARRKQ